MRASRPRQYSFLPIAHGGCRERAHRGNIGRSQRRSRESRAIGLARAARASARLPQSPAALLTDALFSCRPRRGVASGQRQNAHTPSTSCTRVVTPNLARRFAMCLRTVPGLILRIVPICLSVGTSSTRQRRMSASRDERPNATRRRFHSSALNLRFSPWLIACCFTASLPTAAFCDCCPLR
jgi:hypothetical protein